MITANELRLGNLVNFMEDDTIFTVDEIVTDGIGVHNEEESTWIEIDQFSGIPLTEEWLLMFGFRKANGKMYFLPIPLLSMEIHAVFFRNEWLIELANDRKNIVTEVTKIHQLQNLFHALTGKELEVVNEN